MGSTLTMVGGDTHTAAIGTSMREVVELTAARDPRITFESARERPGLGELIAAHDVGVLPSVWEC